MRHPLLSLVLLLAAMWPAAAPAQESAPAESADDVHRYLVVRTFPAGALAGLDEAAKAKVNATNANHDVRWIHSYANADLTRTYCIYEGPDEQAIRKAAEANGIPVDTIFEIPVDLEPSGG